MKRWVALMLMCCAALPLWAAGGSTQVARIHADKELTHVFLPLTGSAEHRLLTLDDPPRLVIDLRGPGVPARMLGMQTPGSIVNQVRSGARDTGELRVVLDLADMPRQSSARLEKNQSGAYRLAVELRHAPRAVARSAPPSAPIATAPTPPPKAITASRPVPTTPPVTDARREQAATAPAPEKTRPAKPAPQPTVVATTRSSQPQKPAASNHEVSKLADKTTPLPAIRPGKRRTVIVAVDAGHGGKDPGAAGKGGTREKDVTLAIARELARRIDREPGMKAVLTRDGDYFLTLRQRIQIARKHQADLFVSVHADAFENSASRGSSVYVLSQRGATDEAARWLAARENAADLAGGVKLNDKDEVLAQVLLDLSQTATIDASFQVADRVLGELGRLGPLHKEVVQQAGFLVLKSPDIPSILVETAFITNPSEERRLKDPAHQRRIASAIFSGLRSYAAERIPDSRLAETDIEETAQQALSLASDTTRGP